ncbi:50S ribosomal protein L17 [Neochlamydia sp. S13]|jgi:large subunit ribosomal protein L17|nr:50S ribosomal protein L17 [Neochlamydia sp. S13]
MFANMLKSLIENERIETTVPKAKALRRYADKMITLAKKNTLATRRRAISEMMVRFNALTDKEARAARKGDTSAYNTDRQVIDKLFSVLGPRFASRAGGYTRIVKAQRRVGDNTQMCIIEYLDN